MVRPALLWNGTRSADAARELVDELGGPAAWADAVGSVPVASLAITKLRWLDELARSAWRDPKLHGRSCPARARAVLEGSSTPPRPTRQRWRMSDGTAQELRDGHAGRPISNPGDDLGLGFSR